MEFYRCCLLVTFAVLTVDQFVGRDDGALQEPRTEVYCFRLNFNISKLVYSHFFFSFWKTQI